MFERVFSRVIQRVIQRLIQSVIQSVIQRLIQSPEKPVLVRTAACTSLPARADP